MGNVKVSTGVKAILLAIIVATLPRSLFAAYPSPDDLLAAYEASLAAYQHGSYTVNTWLTYSGFALTERRVIEQYTYVVTRDGRKAKFIVDGSIDTPVNGKLIHKKEKSEWLFPTTGWIRVLSDPGKQNMRPSVIASLNELSNGEWVTRSWLPFAYVVDGSFEGNGDSLLPQILRESALSVRTVNQDQSTLAVLESQGRWGRHTLWFDSNLTPFRIEQEKKPDDWIETNLPLSAAKPFDGRLFPKAHMIAARRTLDTVRTERVQGRILPTHFKLSFESKFDNGQTVLLTTDIRFSKIQLTPEAAGVRHAFSLTTTIPDGTRVEVHDPGGIEYEWNHGQIVKAINQTSVANLEGNFFQVTSWMPRLWVITAIIATTILAGWLWRRHSGPL